MIQEKSKQLVNDHLGANQYSWRPKEKDTISKVRDHFIDYIHHDIYKKLGDYGYFFQFKNEMKFQEGKEACEKINGHIVEFDETATNAQDFLIALSRQYWDPFWIGLTDEESKGSYKWLKQGTYYSKMPSAMAIWARGSPTNVGSIPAAFS